MINLYTSCKSYFICVLLCLFVNNIFAQQIPVFNQYIYNPQFFNPAALGDGFVGLQYRSQFSELDSKNAPRSFSVNTDLSSALNLSAKKIGIGLSLYSDKAHIVNRLKGKLSFAYHLIQNENSQLSAGIEAGIFSQRIDFGDTRLSNPQDLLLYNSESGKTVFDGGFGIRYKHNSESGKELNFNLATPQLFTSDLNYEVGKTFATNPHLLAVISYKIPIAATAIEPLIMYRDVLGKNSLKKGNTDLGLRAHFMDNRFWVGGGTRLGGSSYNISFGLQAMDNFHIQGTFETHNMLGNSWEALVVYTFGNSNTSTNTPSTSRPSTTSTAGPESLRTQFKNLELESKQSTVEVKGLIKDANNQFQQAKSLVEEAKKTGISNEAVTFKLNKAQPFLEASKKLIEQALVPATSNTKNEIDAKDLYIQARDERKTNKKIDNSFIKIKEYSKGSTKEVNSLVRSYQQLTKEVNVLKSRTNVGGGNKLESMIASKDVVNLEKHYQDELVNTIGVSTINSVNVTTNGNTLNLKYQYSDSKNNYKLEGSLSQSKFIADHVIQQIKTLKSKKAKIESITVVASLQARKTTLEQTTSKATYREDQFGYRVNIDYKFIDTANQTMQSEMTLVEAGKVSLLQLACLKLHGVQRYLNKNGISSTKHPVDFQLVAPNYEQSTPQEYAIIIEFKK